MHVYPCLSLGSPWPWQLKGRGRSLPGLPKSPNDGLPNDGLSQEKGSQGHHLGYFGGPSMPPRLKGD